MKILHFADCHLGVETYGRLEDFLRCFDIITDYALNKKVDLVVFAGDAYKTREPSPTYQREFAKRIKKMAKKIPVVLVVGNHDLPSQIGRADTLEIFPTLEVPNVYVFSKPTVKEIPIPNCQLPITIFSLPWMTKNQLLSEEESKGRTIEETDQIAKAKLIKIFKDLTKKVDSKKPCLVIAHQTIFGAMYGSERAVTLGREIILPLELFKEPKFDYVALGHIHKQQVLSKNPPVVYSGSIERIDFGEEEEEKGFYEVEIKEGLKKTEFKFIKLPARKFKTIQINVPDKQERVGEYIKKEIEKEDVKEAIVRVNIKSKSLIDSILFEEDLKEALAPAYYVAAITKETEEPQRKILIKEAESLGPLDWLQRYLKEKEIKGTHAEELKKAAEKLMEELSVE